MRTIKKAQTGDTISVKKSSFGTPEQRAAAKAKREVNVKKIDSTFSANADKRGMTKEEYSKFLEKQKKKKDVPACDTNDPNFKSTKCGINKAANKQSKKDFKKMKSGGMLKRADGSYSKRGLYDNIRANKGSGKKPTAAMLKQERKIKSKK
jgi:hypothetical protein